MWDQLFRPWTKPQQANDSDRAGHSEEHDDLVNVGLLLSKYRLRAREFRGRRAAGTLGSASLVPHSGPGRATMGARSQAGGKGVKTACD